MLVMAPPNPCSSNIAQLATAGIGIDVTGRHDQPKFWRPCKQGQRVPGIAVASQERRLLPQPLHFYRDRCNRIEGRPGLALRFGEYLSWVTIHRSVGGPSTANVPHNRTSPALGPARIERPVLPGTAGKCSQSLI